ncbi:MAG: hypothetical protein WA705_01185 [Candidatus Ozemobacteraceae bacterium]
MKKYPRRETFQEIRAEELILGEREKFFPECMLKLGKRVSILGKNEAFIGFSMKRNFQQWVNLKTFSFPVFSIRKVL